MACSMRSFVYYYWKASFRLSFSIPISPLTMTHDDLVPPRAYVSFLDGRSDPPRLPKRAGGGGLGQLPQSLSDRGDPGSSGHST
jgi:hypothetical protein